MSEMLLYMDLHAQGILYMISKPYFPREYSFRIKYNKFMRNMRSNFIYEHLHFLHSTLHLCQERFGLVTMLLLRYSFPDICFIQA